MSDLNRRTAEAMGWTKHHIDIGAWDANRVLCYCEPDTKKGWGKPIIRVEHFDPCNRINHARILEDYIEKQRKDNPDIYSKYVFALMSILGGWSHNHTLDIYKAIQATPEQRTRAFLEAVEGEKE